MQTDQPTSRVGFALLIEDPVEGLVIERRGSVLVNVPRPARFAIHKLWVSTRRGVAQQNRARKDVAQAAQLLDLLLRERPDDVEEACRGTAGRERMRAETLAAISRLGEHGLGAKGRDALIGWIVRR